jgi:hypothetical protein
MLNVSPLPFKPKITITPSGFEPQLHRFRIPMIHRMVEGGTVFLRQGI